MFYKQNVEIEGEYTNRDQTNDQRLCNCEIEFTNEDDDGELSPFKGGSRSPGPLGARIYGARRCPRSWVALFLRCLRRVVRTLAYDHLTLIILIYDHELEILWESFE